MKEGEKNWIDPRIILVRSKIHGIGLRSNEDINKGDIILIWRKDYTDRRGAENARKEGKFAFQWDDDIFSIDTGVMEDAYHVNHSCDPNTWLEDAHRLSAMRDIKKGEEITVDYALFDHDEERSDHWKCKCGSPNCRGEVTGSDWKDPKLQKRYKDHFSPLLNKRIKEHQMK